MFNFFLIWWLRSFLKKNESATTSLRSITSAIFSSMIVSETEKKLITVSIAGSFFTKTSESVTVVLSKMFPDLTISSKESLPL